MPVFLDTRGKSKLAVAICARCSRKFAYSDLCQDPNAPGLYVCPDDLDQFDPYRLPPHPTENITLEHARPDVSLAPGPMDVFVKPLQAAVAADYITEVGADTATGIAAGEPLTSIGVSQAWSANTFYPYGAQVTPQSVVGFASAGTTSAVYTCLIAGISGATAPAWNDAEGALVTDNLAVWINSGIAL